MHPHVALVKNPPFQANGVEGQGLPVPAMDIIITQAQLMKAGSLTFQAIKAGQIADILAGLVTLAYNAVQALVKQNAGIINSSENIPQTYQMLTIKRLALRQD